MSDYKLTKEQEERWNNFYWFASNKSPENIASFLAQEIQRAVEAERELIFNSFYGNKESKSRDLLLKHLKKNQQLTKTETTEEKK